MIEKVNELFDEFKEFTEGSFHNSLWQTIVNADENGYVMGNHAFTYIYVPKKGTNNVGIAHRGKSGYTPCTFSIRKDVDQKTRDAMIDKLNRVVFGVTEELADQIVIQSMV